MGFIILQDSSTGETKTIKPLFLDGDFSAGHPDGLTASSAVVSHGLSIPATGTGTDFFRNTSTYQNLTIFQHQKLQKN